MPRSRPAEGHRARAQAAVAEEFRAALSAGEISLEYQPIVDVGSHRTIAAEALVRWFDGKAARNPATFVPLLERTTAIDDLGAFTLYEACRQGAAWLARGRTLHMAVNVSARELAGSGYVRRVARTLRDTGFPAPLLDLEITERVSCAEIRAITANVNELHAMGIGIAFDDFGTGYNRFKELRVLHLDTLKIDRSFVSEIASDPWQYALLRGMVAMAKSLDLHVVAEGIETPAQFECVRSAECDRAQGFWIGRPKPARQFGLDHLRLVPATKAASGRRIAS